MIPGELRTDHCAAAEPEVDSHVPPRSETSETPSSHFQLVFQLRKDALRFQMFIAMSCFFVYLYMIDSCVMFFSSLYPVFGAQNPSQNRTSAVDFLLVTSHICAIDITSAFFVLCGFFAAYTYENVPAADHADLRKLIAVYALIDVWLAGLLTLLVSSVFHLVRHSFRAVDVALTTLENVFCLRVFDVHQDSARWHSMNPSAWPVLCLFWATLLTSFTMQGNERLRRCHQTAGLVIQWVNACGPILIISLFALVHDNSNVFYMNASNVGYRVLEFNLGICMYSLMSTRPELFWRLAGVASSTCPYVMATFVLVWWAQLGAAVQQQDTQHTSCIRMYHFSPCIEMHHGFLMRGCILGVVLVCRVLMSTEDEMHRLATCVVFDAHALPAAMSAVLLTWPACYLVHLLLEVNFGLQLVHDNAALLTLVVPHIAVTLAMLWDTSWKQHAFVSVDSWLDRSASRLRPV